MKLTLTLCALILLITGGYYYTEMTERQSLPEDTIFDEISYPKGTYYTTTEEGDIVLELAKKHAIAQSEWPKGTKFYFNGNFLEKIKTKRRFKFAQIKFKYGTEFKVEHYAPNILHKMKIAKKMKIDGLDLHDKCNLEFKNYVLYSASCPEFDTVYFKRFIELPVIEEE